MAVQTTSNLSNSVRTQYIERYLEAARMARLYDQLASPAGQDLGAVMQAIFNGSSVQVNFLSDMNIGTTAISEVSDITPQTLVDTTASISPTSRGEALQWSENLDLQAYTNYGATRFEIVGRNMMESIEVLARAAALKGTNIFRNAARASLDAGTSGDRLTDASFAEVETIQQMQKPPPLVADPEGNLQRLIAVIHPRAYYDVRAGGNVV
ncbi:MAG: hypothetical protein ACE5FI_17465, partial [Anaerolineales bacterium]